MSDLILDLLKAHERLPHRAHQLDGIRKLVERDFFALFDEVGAGKSKQVVDASQILFSQGRIDTAIVITPGFARSVWAEEDPILGEVAKHAWENVPNVIHEYHKDYDELQWDAHALNWVVSNYEFIRRDDRLLSLIKQLRNRKPWLILDESWAVKGNSDQTKACLKLRYKRADRVTILNGTPLADGKPKDLFYQMQILDRDILGAANMTHFKRKYCVMGGYMNKQIVDYVNLDELNARVAPHVLSRRTRDCFDLPPMLDPILIEARLSDATWRIYKEMRDEMVSFLGGEMSVSKQAIVRALRLAQICSGYLGGLESIDDDLPTTEGWTEPTKQPAPQWLRSMHELPPDPSDTPVDLTLPKGVRLTKEIGREKLDAFMNWLGTFPQQPKKLLVWCRFSPELERTTTEVRKLYRNVQQLRGGQKKDERDAAKRLLSPDADPNEEGAVCGNQKAGGASLNFSAANIAVYLSQGPALIERTQSIGRIERPGQRNPIRIVDVVATGPKGQRTIDHHILKSLRSKDDMARWTVDQWRAILRSE